MAMEEEEEDSVDSDEDSEEESEEDEDDSFVADSEEEDEDGENAFANLSPEAASLANLSPDELDKEYGRRAEKLLELKGAGKLTGGQFHFEQTCLDIEFRQLAEVQELRAGKAARAKY